VAFAQAEEGSRVAYESHSTEIDADSVFRQLGFELLASHEIGSIPV